MSFKIKSVSTTIALLLAMASLFTGLFVYQHRYTKKSIDLTQFHGTYLQNPRAINEFALTGIDNEPFNNQSLKGKWTLVFFGFTNCGYVCPTTLAELAKMYHILENHKIKNLPQVVMITLDPERDSLTRLQQYVTSFNPNFYGARGEEEVIAPMTREMGIAYAKVINKDENDSQNYDMQHSGAVMLFNPQGELNAFFTTPHRADWLAKDYMLLTS
ncbi:MAG: photosynthetic protein synthase I [Legionella sp.]|nr:MAG: photosynthetic protein synthase I [Legionella sp.]PJE00079.1 MAG: photosynthetic protein synthase I [Legionella sp.]